MDEINVLMTQFQVAIKLAVESEVKRQIGAQVSGITLEDAPVAHGRKPYAPSAPKPCPVTGVLNTHRRFSYLMPEVRTPENLKKFKKGGNP